MPFGSRPDRPVAVVPAVRGSQRRPACADPVRFADGEGDRVPAAVKGAGITAGHIFIAHQPEDPGPRKIDIGRERKICPQKGRRPLARRSESERAAILIVELNIQRGLHKISERSDRSHGRSDGDGVFRGVHREEGAFRKRIRRTDPQDFAPVANIVHAAVCAVESPPGVRTAAERVNKTVTAFTDDKRGSYRSVSEVGDPLYANNARILESYKS